MIASIDVGYGFTKTVASNGRRAVFPSTLSRAGGNGSLAGVLGAGGKDGHTVRIMRNGAEEVYRVGTVSGARSWELDAVDRIGYDALLFSALALVGADGEVDVAVGLPLALFTRPDQRTALADFLRNMEAWVSVDGADARRITISSIRVYPQGAGAVALALANDPALAQRPIGLVDVGYRTTDLIAMRRVGGALAPDEDGAGSIDMGAGAIYETVRQRIEREHGVLIPEGEVESAEAEYGGKMWLRGEEIDAGAMLRAEARSVATQIASEVRRLWAGRLDLLGTLLVAGGGGALMFSELRTLHPTARLMPSAVYANAEGYLLLAQRPTPQNR